MSFITLKAEPRPGALQHEPRIDPRPGQYSPALFVPTSKAAKRFFEFFTTQLNNDHTRKAYLNATRRLPSGAKRAASVNSRGRPFPYRGFHQAAAETVQAAHGQAASGGPARAV